MTPRRRRRTEVALAALAVLATALLLAPSALASAGGGSSGFGGGGHGGKGVGIYILFQILIRIAIFGHGLGALFLIVLIVLALLFTNLGPRAKAFWAANESSGRASRRRTARRERRVELAAAEAADDDPGFAPDVVRPAAAKLFAQIQAAWDAGDRAALGRLIAPELMAEWQRRLDDFQRRGWRNRVQPLGEPAVEYVGLQHRGDPSSDRVTVRIEARLKDYVEDASGNHIKRAGRFSETTRIREFWTLGKRGGRWVLVSIEQGAEGAHALDEQIVATPWSDEQAMRDEALVEGAVADAVPQGTNIAELADLQFEGDARAAALDLSLADGRFAPDVLEVAARRAVAAWSEAVDGGDGRLRGIASPQAASELLHPGDPAGSTRLVVRGPTVKRIRIAALDAAAEPPTMSVEVDLEGRRYVEDRDTAAVVSGSQSRTTSFTEHWTFALDGDPQQPWRICAVGTKATLAARPA
jgi:predicted lipid-binding transport protein (Tim44 family)